MRRKLSTFMTTAVMLCGVATMSAPVAVAADPLLSTGKPATASSSENATYAPALALDQNAATRWASVTLVDPQWIYVDLGRSATISRVVLEWERAHAVAYRVEVSTNASTWTPVFTTTTGDGGVDDLSVAGTGRYVRMYGTQRGCTGCSQNWGYSLWEFEVYGAFTDVVRGGYYLGGNADITADTVGQGMNLKSITAYRSFYDRNVFPGWNMGWINNLMTTRGVEPVFVIELKHFGGPPGSSIACNGQTYSIPAGNMSVSFPVVSTWYGYNQVTSGAIDGLLCNAVNQLNAMPPGPITVQFISERDTYHQLGITQAGVNYTWAQADAMAIPAMQYLITYFKTRNTRTPRPTFVAGMGGWDRASFARSYLPEADYLQWNPYNHSAPSRSPYDVFSRTYSWLGDLPASSAAKQVIITEFGTNRTFGNQAQWLRDLPAAIARLPRIRMTNYFNSDGDWGILEPKQAGLDALKYAYSQPPYA